MLASTAGRPMFCFPGFLVQYGSIMVQLCTILVCIYYSCIENWPCTNWLHEIPMAIKISTSIHEMSILVPCVSSWRILNLDPQSTVQKCLGKNCKIELNWGFRKNMKDLLATTWWLSTHFAVEHTSKNHINICISCAVPSCQETQFARSPAASCGRWDAAPPGMGLWIQKKVMLSDVIFSNL